MPNPLTQLPPPTQEIERNPDLIDGVDPLVTGYERPLQEAETLRTKSQHMSDAFALRGVATGAALVGGIDTILQSVGFADESTIPDLLNGTDVGKFYGEHREMSQLAGDVAFGFGIVGGAMKLARSGSYAEKVLNQVTNGNAPKWLFTSGKTVDELMLPIAQRDMVVQGMNRSKSALDDDVAKQLVNQATRTRVADTIKESLWADTAFLALQNEALPDDMSATTTAALFLIPDAIFAGGAAVAARADIRKMRVKLAGDIAVQQNPRGFDVNKMPVSAQGMYDASISMRATMSRDLKEEMNLRPNDSEFQKNASTELNVWNAELFTPATNSGKGGEIAGLGKSTPYLGVTQPFQMGFDSIETARVTLDSDPMMYMNAVSFERWDDGFHTRFYGARDTKVKEINKAQQDIFDVSVATGIPLTPKQMAEQQAAKQQRQELNELQTFVNEVDGTLTPTAQRKWSTYDDMQTPVKHHAGRSSLEGPRLSMVFTDDDGMAKTIGMTADGRLLMPEAPKIDLGTFVGGVNVSKAGLSVQEAMAETKYLLKDIGEDWHYATGKYGNKVFESLDQDIKNQLVKWTGSSDRNSSKFREWEETNSPEFQAFRQAYKEAGLHKRFEEIADPDGTITLFRGESKAETKNPKNNLVSMSSNPKLAATFGQHLTSRRVPIEDVVGVIGGSGTEWEFMVTNHKQRNFDGSVSPITKTAFQPLGLQGHMSSYKLARQFLHEVVPSKKSPFMVYPGQHHVELDLASDIIETYGGLSAAVAQGKIKLAGKVPFKSAEDIEFAAINQKFAEIQNFWNVQNSGKGGILKLTKKQTFSDADIARMHNFPPTGNTGMHPLTTLLREVAVPGQTVDLRTFFRDLTDLKNGIKQTVGAKNADEFSTSFKFRGSLISAPLERSPFVVAYKGDIPSIVTPDMVNQRAIAYKMDQQTKFGEAKAMGATIVDTVLATAMKHKEHWTAAARPDLLFEGQASGRGVLNFRRSAVRQSPTMQAADSLVDISGKAGNKHASDAILLPVMPTFTKISSLNHRGDLAMFEMARNARRQGWDVLAEPVQDPTTMKWFLALDPKSDLNKSLLAKHFPGTELTDGMFMPALIKSQKGFTPLAMSDLALEALQAERTMSDAVLANSNFFRYAQGKAPIKKKEWHVLPANLDKEANVFLFNAKTLKPVHIVAGDSLDNAVTHAEKIIAEAAGTDSPLFLKHSNSVEEYMDMMQEVWGKPENFAITYLQSGKRATGMTASPVVETGTEVVKQMLMGYIRQFDNIVKMTHSTMFDTELAFARHQAASLASSSSKQEMGSNKKFRETIWDQYNQIITNKSGLNNKTPVGGVYSGIQTAYEAGLTAVAARTKFIRDPISNPYYSELDKLKYAALAKEAGAFNPFTSIIEYGKLTHRLEVPSTMRDHMQVLNNTAINLSLRLGDLGMAVVNAMGLVAVMPAVIKSAVRQAGESVADHNKRVGPFATVVNGDIAIPNNFRALTTAVHGIFNDPQVRQAVKDAEKGGLLAQEVAERVHLLGAPGKGYVSSTLTKLADVLSVATDKSEYWSRGISFVTGYQLARYQMRVSHDDAIMFGHKIANASIGDYRTSNRPQIFQGSAGAPLGLFTTFMWNFFSRVFHDVEDRRWGSVVKQIGWQAGLFGAESLPGFDSFQQIATENYDGTENLTDRLRRTFGEDVTDVLLRGSVSNVGKLFGAEDSVDITSRASIDFPFSSVDSFSNLPAFSTAITLADGARRMAKSLVDNGGFNSRQITEILSNHAVNGAVRDSLDWYMGYDVDKRGNLLNAKLDSSVELAARMMGFKTGREARAMQENSRSIRTAQMRSDRLESLNEAIMADVRAGKITAEDPSTLNEHMRRAIKIGMTFGDFKRILAANTQRALVDKTSRTFMQAYNSSHRQRETARLWEFLDESDAGMD